MVKAFVMNAVTVIRNIMTVGTLKRAIVLRDIVRKFRSEEFGAKGASALTCVHVVGCHHTNIINVGLERNVPIGLRDAKW